MKYDVRLISGGVVKPEEITTGVLQIETIGSGGKEPVVTGGGIIKNDTSSGGGTTVDLFVQTEDYIADGISYSKTEEVTAPEHVFSYVYKNGYNNTATSNQILVNKNNIGTLYLTLSKPKLIETFKLVAYSSGLNDSSCTISISAFNNNTKVFEQTVNANMNNTYTTCEINSVVSKFEITLYASAKNYTSIRAIKIN